MTFIGAAKISTVKRAQCQPTEGCPQITKKTIKPNHRRHRHTLQMKQNDSALVDRYDDDYYLNYAHQYINFTYNNPTLYHAISHFSHQLKSKGFKYLDEKDNWSGIGPGKYFTVRLGLLLSAFIIGDQWLPKRGVGFIGTHIDSLTAVLKPKLIKNDKDGYQLLGIAPYSGGLSPVWWDRDLAIGGRLWVKDKDGKVTPKLVDSSPHPIGHIPSLAPHFGTPSKGPFNKETQAIPVIGYGNKQDDATDEEKKAPLYGKHSLQLLRYIAQLGKVSVNDIVQWDIQLYDVQKGAIGGLDDDFIFAPRVDDKACLYAAIYSLLEADHEKLLKSDGLSMVNLYDNEEIGSLTRQGAEGGLFEAVITRIVGAYLDNQASVADALRVVYANLVLLSADVVHLVNPNFDQLYLEGHKPVPNKGMTIALDANGAMATDSVGLSLIEEVARKNGDDVQYAHNRNDTRDGGTIGPTILANTGARTIDLGIPQLSMHLIRATLGVKDIGLGIKFFKGFWQFWRETYDLYDGLV